METREFLVVNSFAEKPFGGNPAAVFPESDGLVQDMMQAIARQMNLVETVFVFRSECADYQFRYFTPEEELPVAGHPTIAAALVLVQMGKLDALQNKESSIQTGKGLCSVRLGSSDVTPQVFMSLPQPVFGEAAADRRMVAEALGIETDDLMDELPIMPVDTGLGHLIVPVKSRKSLFQIRRRTELLRALCASVGAREVQAFTFDADSPANSLHTRNICPREGNEDPACGTGNGALGAYLLKNCYRDKREITLRAEQGAIVSMPSVIHISASRQDDGIRVSVGGSGVTMIRGVFTF